MRANIFLIINAVIVGYLILRLFLNRKSQRPTPLKDEIARFRHPAAKDLFRESRENYTKANPQGPKEERSLNCLFQYNGHTWDAFEVLGIPGGSDPAACQRALHDMRRNSEAAKEFLDLVDLALKQYFST
ncbi:MAG: hypothetical protein SGI74_02760 [Oligoflexia bacterium]|nr:hypothetical protein [Oligoflexia bacterium]